MSLVSTEPLYGAIAAAAERHGRARFTVGGRDEPRTIELGLLVRLAGSVAGGLARAGLAPGGVVALLGTHEPEYLTCIVAAAQLGAHLLLLPPHLGAREIGFAMREMDATLLVHSRTWRNIDLAQTIEDAGPVSSLRARVVWGGHGPGARDWSEIAAAPPAPVSSDDVDIVIYSSGTTSEPKGIIHRGAAAADKIRSVIDVMESWRVPGGTMLAAWPAGTIGGFHAVLRFLVGGQDVVMVEHWYPQSAARLIEMLGIDYVAGSPIHLAGLLDAAEAGEQDIGSLKACVIGGAPVRAELVARCEARGITGFRAYGSTEHPFSTQGTIHDAREKRLATDGRPGPRVEIRIVDEAGDDVTAGENGEVVSRGPDLFRGYRRAALDAAAFLPGGWYRSGDIGHFDPDGFLVISDRKKDVIIRGGENISAEEVEKYLLRHPAVVEAAAVAAPDARLGEIVCAVVVLAPGATLDLAEIGRHFRALGVTRRKTPERLEIVPALPRNILGKILKAELRSGLVPST